MKAEPLGESALILRDLAVPAYEVAEAILAASIPGVIEAVASYESVGIYFDPLIFDFRDLNSLDFRVTHSPAITHEIPVCYELGVDLLEIAEFLGMNEDQVVAHHTSATYRCFAVGFCPGFPYLGYLPSEISGTPRRGAPRARVEPGSVAITGRQTGIYPLTQPGGWNLIGKTPLCLVDVESAYFPIKAGDEIRFMRIGLSDFRALEGNRL